MAGEKVTEATRRRGSTCTLVGVSALLETTGTLVTAVCHVQFSHSPPPSSDSTTRPGHVTVHTHSRAIGGPYPIVARGGGGRETSTGGRMEAVESSECYSKLVSVLIN